MRVTECENDKCGGVGRGEVKGRGDVWGGEGWGGVGEGDRRVAVGGVGSI